MEDLPDEGFPHKKHGKEGEVLEKVLSRNQGAAGKPEAPVIEIKNVKKVYRMGSERINAVDDVSFEISKGEFCCLLGTSGSGKSTLLNLMAGIEKASGGQILIKGKNIRKMSEKQLAKFRQKYLGFVFQSYNLLNSMTALENVEFPLVFKRISSRKRKKMAKDMLVKVGLGTRLNHRPKQMSGGQQQRVGIARAFVAKPEIVFADEPTGNLDTRTTMEVMALIKKMAEDNRQTIVMVTHDPRLADFADKIIHILDGKIQSVEIKDHSKDMPAGDTPSGGMPKEDTSGTGAEAAQMESAAGAEAEAADEAGTAEETGAAEAATKETDAAKDAIPEAAGIPASAGREETAEAKARAETSVAVEISATAGETASAKIATKKKRKK